MTKGKIKIIKDFHIQLPDVPDKSEILFSNYPKKDQYWRRTQYSKYFHDFIPYAKKGEVRTKAFQKETVYDSEDRLISLSEEDSLVVQRELRQENNRRMYGVYSMMNGELVWICPDYYYNLQWCQMKDLAQKYGNFREIQNDVLTVYRWALWPDQDWITSYFIPKCKKSGITQILAGTMLNEGSYLEGAELLAASKEYPHITDVFMAYLFHSYDNLPKIMQPMCKKRNLHEIIFGKPPAAKGSSGSIQGTGLNSRIAGQKTKPTCFDGPVVKRGVVDEFPKWWEASKVSPKVAFSKMSETVKLQQKKNGLLVFPSYMPEVDDRGYYEYRELCQNSQLALRDPVTGQTPTGGICLEVTALDSNEECFDIYGKCDQKKAYFLVSSEYNSKNTSDAKQAHKRQYPMDKNDMYDSGGRGKTFDNIRLSFCYRELSLEISTGVLPFRLGNLRWDNSLWESGAKGNRRPQGEFGTVYFDELDEEERITQADNATLKIFQNLPADLLNVAVKNGIRDFDDGFLTCNDDNSMVGSFDPSDYVLKSDVVEFSMNAGHGGFIYDPKLHTRTLKTNQLVYEYHFRHDDPDDTLEDLVKIILYFNARVIIEANKKWLVTAIKKEGLHHFLLLKQKDGSIKPYTEGDENELVNTTTDMIDAYCRAINRYWHKPKSDDDLDNMKTVKSLPLLQQHMDFDVTNTKKYDLVVSYGYWRLAVESFSVFITERRAENNYDSDSLQTTFDNLLM